MSSCEKFSKTAGVANRAARLMLSRDVMQDAARYQSWRAQKLRDARRFLAQPFVDIRDPANLSAPELEALHARMAAVNFALYRVDPAASFGPEKLTQLCRQLGLTQLSEENFAAAGVSEIRVATHAPRCNYIPYTTRALGWHTDGYYHSAAARIDAFAMHTVRAAVRGGGNQFLDHEILYLLLRDCAPEIAAEFFSADALTIPADGARPLRTGPVFLFGDDGRLRMRFTLRKRNAKWSPQLRDAADALRKIFGGGGNNFIAAKKFAPGEGVIANNVPHNRAAFAQPDKDDGRLVLRARFMQRAREI